MAATITARGYGTLSANSGTIVSNTFTPAANSILFLVSYHSDEGGPIISGVTGHGTWANVFAYNVSYENRRIEVWACKVGASPSSAAITATYPYMWKSLCEFFEASGDVDVSGTAANAFGVNGSANKLEASATATNTIALGSFARAGGLTFVVGTCSIPTFEGGYTALTSRVLVGDWNQQCGYIGSEDNSVVVTQGAFVTAQAAAFEIKAAAGGGSSIAPLSINDTSIEDNQSGLTITMSGGVGGFGASQGTGVVIVSPTDNVNDGSATPQVVNGWGDTSINITGYRGSRALNTNLYLFVKNNAGLSNANGLVVQFVPTKYLKVLVDSSAQSATGIKGVVYQAPSGATIAGPEIGEFNSYTFSGTLESGQAVLKVPVAAFGGTSLTTSDTPVVLVKNTTHTTGIISATIIEE
jgi:hypothetical protein